MREYVIHVVGTVLAAAALCDIFPKSGEGKWVRFAAGLVVACAVFSPLLSLNGLPKTEFILQELTLPEDRFLAETFEERLAEDLEHYLQEQTGEHVSATVVAQGDDTGNITGVSQVRLAPYRDEYAVLVAAFLDIDSSKVVAL